MLILPCPMIRQQNWLVRCPQNRLLSMPTITVKIQIGRAYKAMQDFLGVTPVPLPPERSGGGVRGDCISDEACLSQCEQEAVMKTQAELLDKYGLESCNQQAMPTPDSDDACFRVKSGSTNLGLLGTLKQKWCKLKPFIRSNYQHGAGGLVGCQLPRDPASVDLTLDICNDPRAMCMDSIDDPQVLPEILHRSGFMDPITEPLPNMF
jgi:hypothetical protein